LKPRGFASNSKQSVAGFLETLQTRHIGLAYFVQAIEMRKFGLDLSEVQDAVHAVRSLLCGPIGVLKGRILDGVI